MLKISMWYWKPSQFPKNVWHSPQEFFIFLGIFIRIIFKNIIFICLGIFNKIIFESLFESSSALSLRVSSSLECFWFLILGIFTHFMFQSLILMFLEIYIRIIESLIVLEIFICIIFERHIFICICHRCGLNFKASQGFISNSSFAATTSVLIS